MDAVGKMMGQIPQANHIFDMDALEMEVTRGVQSLADRDIVVLKNDAWTIAEGETPVVQFYANSISQFIHADAATAS